MEPSPVHLGQVPYQLGLDASTAPDQFGDAREKKIVGQRVEMALQRLHAFIHNTEVYRPRQSPLER
jgi:hypothetical protein